METQNIRAFKGAISIGDTVTARTVPDRKSITGILDKGTQTQYIVLSNDPEGIFPVETASIVKVNEQVTVYPVREVNGHEINRANQMLVVSAGPEGPGNAAHDYWINDTHGLDNDGCPTAKVHIHFQEGPIAEAGLNGITNEALLSVLIDRMNGFQAGPYACRENEIALTKMEEAMHWLHHRTHSRVHRGIEGTSAVNHLSELNRA